MYEGEIIMAKRYVYKNVNSRPVNIQGYQFQEEQELESDILINSFNEAVSNGFLDLIDRKLEVEESDATQAPQTGDTGEVKVIFHMGADTEGKETIKEVEVDPNTPVDFPIEKDETFEGWFKDAEFTKPVNVDKAKAPKKGDLHFYGKYATPKKEDTPPVDSNPNGGIGSEQESGQVVFPPPHPPTTGEEFTTPGSENK
jgi:hypothetical protein